jgi:hypothetical protein
MTNRRLLLVALASTLALPLVHRAAFAQSSNWPLQYIDYYSNVGSNPPNVQEPTFLRLHGWFPYACGRVTGVYATDPGNVNLTLRPGVPGCVDTLRQWTADYDLGYLPLGDHTVNVRRTFVAANGDSITETGSFTFPVVDLNLPPPPPPPPPPPGPPYPYWVVLYVSSWTPIPQQPHALAPTTSVLYGQFPYSCGEIVDATSDSANISFTMRPGPPCSDSTRTWSHAFNHGILSAGFHVIHIKRRFISPDSNEVAEGDFGFQVWADPNTPPPPIPPGPPEFPSWMIRCLTGWYTTAPLTIHAPTTLVLWGWFPYLCGQVVNASVVSPNHVALTLRPGPACTDTVVTWSQSFDLGLLPGGPNDVKISLNVENDPGESLVGREATITLYVDDRDVSASIPNPFVSDTRFMVNTNAGDDVDVAIYDLNGRRVASLFKGRIESGAREFRWNGKRDDGSRAAIGIYFSRVAFSNRVVTRKLVMLPR